ncbi:helix-turn-helix domain-containing protein [Catenisphaera adipataccumulans]|jgi:transcriptional regulator with XRE-family HTH domain|uniref:Transcriptional regulator with XRE-family HTH domain n=1 Tax=Catenisphaera adipataccumulans TaxID=700500 RepID=A0A7W8CYJ9_9FIRM|nr:helix-turn-helix transcriptional regulator [Catenisphaera adipataccumulans]MBB5183958.1 transcriptional regulator with XRE-family HTH domain [Catenisphaera adipataccumulans]
MKLKRIRDLREDNDLTQAEIAKILSVTQRTYSRYENDDRSIPLEQLIKLADFYHTSVDYLLNRTDKKEPY